jgi:hypothetical protein
MDGYWKPRRGVVARTGSLTSGGDPLQLPFFLIDVAKSITAASVAAGVVTITTSVAHGLTGSGLARITGLVGNAVMDGDFTLTVLGASTLTYPVVGLTSISDQIGTLSTTPINDAANVNVRASCLFSDPNSGNAESVVLALDSKAILVDLDGYTTQDIEYPTGKSLAGDTDMIQAFDRVYLFRDGAQAFEWFPNGRNIESASSSAFTVTMRVRDHGLTVGDSIVVSGLTVGVPANGTFAVVTVTDKDVFTYTFTTSQTETFVVTDAVLKADFTLVPGGTYTQPQVFVSTTGTVSKPNWVNNSLNLVKL